MSVRNFAIPAAGKARSRARRKEWLRSLRESGRRVGPSAWPFAAGPGGVSSTARSALFSPLAVGDRVEAVVERLAGAIRLGMIEDGEQLPREVELALSLGVSTVTLREALSQLRTQGIIETRRGRGGGSFARAQDLLPASSLRMRLRRFGAYDLRDLGDQHSAVFSMASRRAAERVSEKQLAHLRRLIEALAAAMTPGARRRADARFSVELAAAAQSVGLTGLMIKLQQDFADLAWLPSRGNPRDDERYFDACVTVNRAVLDAVADGNAKRAAEAAEQQVEDRVERIIDLRYQLMDRSPPSARLVDEGRRQRSSDGPGKTLDSLPDAVWQISSFISSVFKTIERIQARTVDIVERADAAGRPLRRNDFLELDPLLRDILDRRKLELLGAGFIANPGLLSDVPRWIVWRCPRPGGEPAQVSFNLDEKNPDAYDYPAAEWFSAPRSGVARTVAGPYVDVGGINAYTLTLTVPVSSRGRFIGAAGADVPLERVEAILRRSMRSSGQRAVLVNSGARIVASSVRRHYPGGLLRGIDLSAADEQPAGDGWIGYHCPGLPWRLLVPDSR